MGEGEIQYGRRSPQLCTVYHCVQWVLQVFLLTMLITTESLTQYAGANVAQRNYREGDRLERSNFVISCGKNEEKSRPGFINFTAYCLSVTHLKEKPYEINGEFTESGEILSCVCSCPAGLGEMCKHVISVLKHLEKRTEPLEILSCTDKKCPWKRSFQVAMESFEPAPLMLHPCYCNKKNETIDKSEESKKQCIKNISNAQSDHLRAMIYQKLPKSAIAKDASKRHTIKSITVAKGLSDSERTAIQIIFQFQRSDLMQKIQDLTTGVLKECCKSVLLTLQGNEVEICIETKNFFDAWLRERTRRITGSTCYKVYTYAKNKNPNWKNKANEIFDPKDFKTEATEYGKKAEEEARQEFINVTKKTVIQTVLIISVQNPWLGYSPDGVILQAGKPHAVLEIKCPVIGKKEGITACIDKCLTMFLVRPKGEENITLKQKHPYYGQVQLGMAVINVQEAVFVIYSSFEKTMFTLRLKRDETFLMKMLSTLKKSYHEEMLHFLCLKKNQES